MGRGPVPHAVRIALGTPADRTVLRRALDALREVLGGEAAVVAPIV